MYTLQEVIQALSGPLNRSNAILSLLRPLDAMGPLCDRECDWEALPRIHTQVGVLNHLVLNHLRKLNRALVVLECPKRFLKQARNKNAIEAAILNHVLDRD